MHIHLASARAFHCYSLGAKLSQSLQTAYMYYFAESGNVSEKRAPTCALKVSVFLVSTQSRRKFISFETCDFRVRRYRGRSLTSTYL